jgi:aerobic-type carbon monoxide dehydrogenase small subunit (CoxS/CutS family)
LDAKELKMRLPKFEYLEPKSLKEASKALAIDLAGSVLLAGETDLIVNIKHRLGTCGACSVLIDGKPYLSCLTLAAAVQRKKITTIEGLVENGELHPLQKAFIEKGAIQCGFCTPGMILTAKGLLNEHPHPSEEKVKKAISGNLCRCTGYVKIVEAVLSVPEKK